MKLPNFLSVDCRPFDPEHYEDEIEDEDSLDEEGRARLKLKVENTIRSVLPLNILLQFNAIEITCSYPPGGRLASTRRARRRGSPTRASCGGRTGP